MGRATIKIIVFLSFFLSAFSQDSFNFEDETYKNYTWQTFYALPEVNEEMNLDKLDIDLLNAAVFYASNEQRAKKKKKTFEFHGNLRDAATFHSKTMAQKNFFSHKNKKQRKYREFSDRIYHFGGDFYEYTGENIAQIGIFKLDQRGFFFTKKGPNGDIIYSGENGKLLEPHTYLSYAKLVVEEWMNSKPHRENLMADEFKYLGCGGFVVKKSVRSKKEIPKINYTQNFGG